MDSKRDAKRLKQIMITDDEWDLIADLTEVLSVFADATEDLRGSKYVTNSMCTPMLMEIIKVVKPNSSYDQDLMKRKMMHSKITMQKKSKIPY